MTAVKPGRCALSLSDQEVQPLTPWEGWGESAWHTAAGRRTGKLQGDSWL